MASCCGVKQGLAINPKNSPKESSRLSKQITHSMEIDMTAAKSLLPIALVAWLLNTFSAGVQAASNESKDLQIRLRDGTPPAPEVFHTVATEAFQVELTPLQSGFKVNESVRFKVRSSHSFYMYLFSIDEKNNQAVLILPNALQKGNKYPANQTMVIPNRNIEFYADSPGTEKVIMVASKKYFTWDTNGYTSADKFLVTDANAVHSQLKRLNVRPAATATKPGRSDADIYVQELLIKIDGASSTGSAPSSSNPIIQQIMAILKSTAPFASTQPVNLSATDHNADFWRSRQLK